MKLNCHIEAKYLSFCWLHTTARLSSLSCNDLIAEFPLLWHGQHHTLLHSHSWTWKKIFTTTALETYLAWYKSNTPSWTEQPLTVLSERLDINSPAQVATQSSEDSAATQGPLFQRGGRQGQGSFW